MATTAHWVIYVVLIVVAGSGYVHVVGDGFPIEVMDALGLPSLLPLMPGVASWASLVHRFSTFLLIALVSVHVAEVLRHHLVLRDGTLQRMWPPLGGRELRADSEAKPEGEANPKGAASPEGEPTREGGTGGVAPS